MRPEFSKKTDKMAKKTTNEHQYILHKISFKYNLQNAAKHIKMTKRKRRGNQAAFPITHCWVYEYYRFIFTHFRQWKPVWEPSEPSRHLAPV